MPTMTAAREAMLAKYTTSRETHHRSDQSNRFGKEQANLVVHLGQEHAPKRPKHADYDPSLKKEVGGYWLVQTFFKNYKHIKRTVFGSGEAGNAGAPCGSSFQLVRPPGMSDPCPLSPSDPWSGLGSSPDFPRTLTQTIPSTSLSSSSS